MSSSICGAPCTWHGWCLSPASRFPRTRSDLVRTIRLLGLTAFVSVVVAMVPIHFIARFAGNQEVPPRPSGALGIATFDWDGTALHYRLSVSHIRNVTLAQLNLGAPGHVGPTVATLFGPVDPRGGAHFGPLASGRLTGASLSGPFEGLPIERLIAAMR